MFLSLTVMLKNFLISLLWRKVIVEKTTYVMFLTFSKWKTKFYWKWKWFQLCYFSRLVILIRYLLWFKVSYFLNQNGFDWPKKWCLFSKIQFQFRAVSKEVELKILLRYQVNTLKKKAFVLTRCMANCGSNITRFLIR